MKKCEKIANALDKAFAHAKEIDTVVVNRCKGASEAINLCRNMTGKDAEYLKTRGYGVGMGRIRSGGRFLRVPTPDWPEDTERVKIGWKKKKEESSKAEDK